MPGRCCTSSAPPTPRWIRPARSTAPPSFSRARTSPTRCGRCRRTRDALKASAAAERAAKASFDLAVEAAASSARISVVALLNAEQTYQQAELALVQARGQSLRRHRRAVPGARRRLVESSRSDSHNEQAGTAGEPRRGGDPDAQPPGEAQRAVQGAVRGARRGTSIRIARETQDRGPGDPARRRRQFLRRLRHAGGARAWSRRTPSRTSLVEVIEKLADLPQPVISAVAGPLLDRRAGAGAGGGPDRRGASRRSFSRRLRALGTDADLGAEPAAAASRRYAPRRAR